MQLRKLDMGKAWTQATGLIGTNRDLSGIERVVAGKKA